MATKIKHKNKNITLKTETPKRKEQRHKAHNICQKKIEEGHSIERVWYNASREPSGTLPGSQPCTQTRSVYHAPYSQGFQFTLTAQSTSLSESLGWSNQRGSKTSQACYSHPRCDLNLVRLFRFSLLLPLMDAFSSSLTHAAINLQPPSCTALYHIPGSSAAVLQSLVMPNSRRSSATSTCVQIFL